MEKIKLHLFLILIFSTSVYSKTVKDLSLLEAVKQGYQKSLEIKEQKVSLEVEELRYKVEQINLYTPNTSLNFNSSLSNTLTQRNSYDGTNSMTAHTESQKSNINDQHSVTLEINEYKLFNSFIDTERLKATKMSLLVNRQNTFDNIRRYIFSIVEAYFDVKTSKDLLDNANNKLSFSKSVLELLELKRKSNPSAITETDILFAKDQVFQAKKEIKEAEINYKSLLLTLNFLITADLEQDYKFTTELKFRPLETNMDKILEAVENSPNVKKSKLSLAQAEFTHKYTIKELLPLPKLTISGFKYGYGFNDNAGGTAGKIQQFTGNNGVTNNLDLRLGITWTIPLSGSNGFFNELTYKSSYLNVERSKNTLTKTRFENLNKFSSLYYRLKSDEEQIKDLQDRVKNSSLLLDEILKKSMKGQIDRKEIEDAITNAISSNQSLLNAIISHFKQKTDLANTLGGFTILGESVF